MKVRYFPDTDTLLVNFSDGKIVDSRDLNEDVLVEQGDLIDIIDHPDQIKYRGQKILFVRIRNYIFAAPFIKDGDDWFLKTIMPSRKATRKYLEAT